MADWQTEVRDGMRIDWDVPIPMDDGLVLRADVFRPVADGQYPVILTYGPYGKGLSFQEGYPRQWKGLVERCPQVLEGSTNKYQNWETVDPEKWVPHGYVCVRVDSRGAGRSPGYLDPFSARETQDLYECIEWAGVQPWSNGKVGLLGISYYAMNQWQVAALQPPHLAAICPFEGASDWYRDATHHGGIVSTFWASWYPYQVINVQHGVGERGYRSAVTGELVSGPQTLSEEELACNRVDIGARIVASPLATDPYNRERAVDWSKVTVPLLSCANWGGLGLHARGNFEGFVRAASKQKWLEVHGWEHWTEFYTPYGIDLQRRFFDFFLKGEDNGWSNQPPVYLNIRYVDEHYEPRAEQAWPLPRTRWTKLYLNAAKEA
ncbi:MAG: CocE/NonD family hydrolase, partial [Alicyclobacillus sp.]|nr:CocE/NonD family hydrolase [Alicyclobacillus sp.]